MIHNNTLEIIIQQKSIVKLKRCVYIMWKINFSIHRFNLLYVNKERFKQATPIGHTFLESLLGMVTRQVYYLR